MGAFSPNFMANNLLAFEKFCPGTKVIVHQDERITWPEFTHKAFCLARALISRGVKKGDNVAFMFHNRPEFLLINAGIQVCGAVPAPMNYRFVAREIQHQADHCEASVFLFDSIWKTPVKKAAKGLKKNISHWIALGDSGMDKAESLDEVVRSGHPSDPGVPTDAQDPAVMIYTGGTTGPPKGVLLSYRAFADMHAALMAGLVSRMGSMDMDKKRSRAILENLGVPAPGLVLPFMRSGLTKKVMAGELTKKTLQKSLEYILLHPERARLRYIRTLKYMVPSLPFFHSGAYGMLMLGMLAGTVTFVLGPGPSLDPDAILDLTERERPVFMANVPAGWKKLAAAQEKNPRDTSSLLIAAAGAGLSSVGLKKKILSCFPRAVVMDLFGQTEMTPVTAFKLDASEDNIKDRSVGLGIVNIKVVDENGKKLSQGQTGEIMYQSPTMMMGYYKDEKKTQESMAGGWFKSGDLGYIDTDGEVRVIDRKKECINTGGEKVFPLEVEEVLAEHPAVESVCVIGIPDPEWGSRIRAVVKLAPGAETTEKQLMDFCREHLAGYKIPRSVVFTEDFPLSPVGKILRNKVRERFGENILS